MSAVSVSGINDAPQAWRVMVGPYNPPQHTPKKFFVRPIAQDVPCFPYLFLFYREIKIRIRERFAL